MEVSVKFDLENVNDKKSMDFFNKRKKIMELLRGIHSDLPSILEEQYAISVEEVSEILEKQFEESGIDFDALYF